MSKDKSKKKAKNEKLTARINSALVLKLMDSVKRLMGEPEHLFFQLHKSVDLSATYTAGSLVLKDSEAVVVPPEKAMRFRLPFVVLKAALKNRGELDLELSEHQLKLVGTRYSAELNIEPLNETIEFKKMKGVDSAPLKELLSNCSHLLNISNMIEEVPIDVHFKWNSKGIVAAAADAYHAVIVRGKLGSKTDHSVTMSVDLASKLSQIGGEFDLNDSQVRASSDTGEVEINQISAAGTIVPLAHILKLLEMKPTWSAEINSGELSALLGNLDAVVEHGNRIQFEIDKKTIHVNSHGGRYGKVSGHVEHANSEGKRPGGFTVSPSIFDSVVGKIDGNIKLGFLNGNMLRLEPSVQGDWNFVGFVHLLGNERES